MDIDKYLIGYCLFFIALLAFNLLINSILLKFATNLGVRNYSENVIRWTLQTKPSLGGFGFYIAFLISLIFFMIFEGNTEIFARKEYLGILAVSSLGFLMGLADDAYNTKPILKFSVQFLCGIILVYTGNFIQITPWHGFNVFITVFWTVGMMNSLNMLDNMDAITGIVSLMIAIIGFLYLIFTGRLISFDAVMLLGLMAALFAFLYYNWYPSKMFMGDSGSQFLGVFMAVIGIRLFWNGPDVFQQVIQTKQFLSLLLVFVVPIADTTTVFINRIAAGKSPFVGGKDHTTHHLAYHGLSQRYVAFVLAAITLISGLLMLFFIQQAEDWGYTEVILFALYYLLVTSMLYLTTRIKPRNGAGNDAN
ncbi:MAG: undecaprenyl/decaprenyl-phosphate alpha-N-acetylglucosaminyl 1-phosphate transferase [Flavobacteriales bacterium]|nr:undecaprenyl/decaprenyl-phosphate alpha-N-acetylglucosaminyl 1-phosphate transferase [Flavobacteriales bacterium]